MKHIYKSLCSLILFFTPFIHYAQSSAADQWAERTFQTLSLDEQIGQLMMIRAHSDKGAEHIAKVEGLIKNYHVGGLCFFQGTPEKQVQLTNRYQALSADLPLMISMDAEWGTGMRFKKDGFSYPRQLMLGAIQNNRLIYDMGKDVARQLRRIGVHVNFAPVVDVNNNPNNPVINTRSFGEDRYNVAAKSYMYMKGMQDGNVMACAKHFPGHGDTDVDSHLDLPIISHDRNRLDSIELLPFRILAQHGIQSMMVAHLNVPTIDATTNRPTTLSQNAVTDLLKNEIGFEGLIFTDGLGMEGVTKYHKSGEVEAKALVAGNDVLLLPQDVPAAFQQIKAYLEDGRLSKLQFEESVKKVLRAKYDLGITHFTPISTINLRQELESPEAQILKRNLIENSLTLVRNNDNLLPIQEVSGKSISCVSIGAKGKYSFHHLIDKYAKIRHFQTKKEIPTSQQNQLLKELEKDDLVIVSLFDVSTYASRDYNFTASMKAFVQALNKKTKVILVVFGTPYSIKYFDDLGTVLVAYTEEEITQQVTAQALFGVSSIRGRLPVTASAKSAYQDGVNTLQLFRMGYDTPESVGMRSDKLLKIDTLMREAISTKATPGGVVLIAKDGKIVFEKTYGYHTYDKRIPVAATDIYDLASITKIAAGTMAVMKLQENNQLNIYQPLSNYISPLKNTDKANLNLHEMMTHHSGLKSWIKFYENTLSTSSKSARPSSRFYKSAATDDFSIPVTEKLFLKTGYDQTMREEIYQSELRSNKNYKYSDLGFYLVADAVRAQSRLSLDQYVSQQFYQPMGLQSMTFNPWRKFSTSRIPPTEKDTYYRRQTVHGYVHDMGAAMWGGVSGHAGLFSNANDLAILMQMILNGGYYGGKQYLNASTIQEFTNRCSACTRRGIGFDMKQLDTSLSENMSPLASRNTFGHLGFTGTCVWVDPDEQLIYILLSNRTYPRMKNFKFSSENYRPRIQSVIYEALEKEVVW